MDSIQNVLKDYSYQKPDSMQVLKEYILKTYKFEPKLSINRSNIVIQVKSASLASNLRLNLPNIKSELNITEKLTILIV
jgi:hypothetical protein